MYKLQVKVKYLNGEKRWMHLCYVPIKLWRRFEKVAKPDSLTVNDWVCKWATADFGSTKLQDLKDLDNLRDKIKLQYRKRYPELYLSSPTDRQGWVRVWCTQHMKKEIENVDN